MERYLRQEPGAEQQAVQGLGQVQNGGVVGSITHSDAAVQKHEDRERRGYHQQWPQLGQQHPPVLQEPQEMESLATAVATAGPVALRDSAAGRWNCLGVRCSGPSWPRMQLRVPFEGEGRVGVKSCFLGSSDRHLSSNSLLPQRFVNMPAPLFATLERLLLG